MYVFGLVETSLEKETSNKKEQEHQKAQPSAASAYRTTYTCLSHHRPGHSAILTKLNLLLIYRKRAQYL
jgi:hypothetical protein